MGCFESRSLVREIGCALGKARNVFHLKEVLHRPLEIIPAGNWESRFQYSSGSKIQVDERSASVITQSLSPALVR